MTDKEFEKMIDKARRDAIAWVNRHRGSTGSNMAEPPYIPPGPTRIPNDISPEERARRERLKTELMKEPSFRKILSE